MKGMIINMIKIITDTVADIPLETAKELGIDLIPIMISHGGRSFADWDMKIEDYHQLLLESPELPTSSQITPNDAYEAYKRAYENGATKVIYLSVTSQYTGCYNSACMGKNFFLEEFPNALEIEVIDTGLFSYLYGLTVQKAAKMANDGESFEDIIAMIKEENNSYIALLGVFNLKHLHKSGRLNNLSTFVGEKLGLKPILRVSTGKVEVLEKTRGVDNMIKKMIKKVKEEAKNPGEQMMMIGTGITPKEHIDFMRAALLGEIGAKEVVEARLGGGLTTNIGPEIIAVVYRI